jgi:UDP-N-acetylmuramoyl-tripeptide--D-alanyl-D-alanine ligase
MYSTYLLLVHAMTWVLALVLLRHGFYRGRYFLHIYQQNGYKLNEFWSWLKQHWNEHVLTPTFALFNLLLVLMLFFGRDLLSETASIWVVSVFVLVWFLPVGPYTARAKKPLAYTARVKRLLVPVSLLYLAPVAFAMSIVERIPSQFPDPFVLGFLLSTASLLQPFFMLLGGWIMKPVETQIQNGFIRQAKRKLASLPDLKIVAITGSYGKTSTKFVIKTLLSERFNVCFTPGSYNTPMGITMVINNDLDASHQILILEMGARYAGNIQELCDIARPDVGVFTNVGLAHLETFGTQDSIAHTKGAILRSLPPNGTAVVNSDDMRVMSQVTRTDISVISAGLQSGRLRAENIRYDATGCHFTAVLDGTERAEVTTKLLGAHNVLNILIGFGVGIHFGLRLQTMALAASRIEPVEHRLELKPLGVATMIDDAFNSNPVGAANAVEVLRQFTGGRRVIVTPGMVELGAIEAEENRKFGEAIGRADLELVILVGEERSKPILEGIRSTGYSDEKIRVEASLFTANEFLRGYLQKGDVVLYENDLPDLY